MTEAHGTKWAYAFDVRHDETGRVVGVGLVVPADGELSYLGVGRSQPEEPELTAQQWRAFDEWAAAANAGLPARPSPIDREIVAALPGAGDAVPRTARRFAAIPLSVRSEETMSAIASRCLPGLLRARSEHAG